MPNTLTSAQMEAAAKKPVVLDLDSNPPPRRTRPPGASAPEPVEVDIEFDPAPAFEDRIDAGPWTESRPISPPSHDPDAEPVVVNRLAADPKPKPTSAEKKRAAARRASGPPKDVKPAPFTRKETIPVRVRANDEVYSVWNCAESPDEAIRVNDERVLRFKRGTLKCLTSADDEAVAIANQYAGGKYIRGEEKYLDDPIISNLTDPPTYWYSQKALQRHQAQYKRDHA